VRSNWEKIYPEILLEATLSKFDQNTDLRTLLIQTDFSGETAGCLLTAQSIFRNLQPHESVLFELYEDEAFGKQTAQTNIPASKLKARNRRDVWRDPSGGSLLQMNSSHSVTLSAGEGKYNIPMSALPNTAKFVVKKYQYEKRFLNDNSEDEDDEDYEDGETFEQQRSGKRVSLAAYLDDSLAEMDFSIPEFIDTATSTLEELKNPRIDLSKVQDLLHQCQLNQQRALEMMDNGALSEENMNSLLQLAEKLYPFL